MFPISHTAELDCQTGLTCTNGACIRNTTDAVESCECDKGYELSPTNSSLCIGKLAALTTKYSNHSKTHDFVIYVCLSQI